MSINLNGMITDKQAADLRNKVNSDTTTRRDELQCLLRHAAYHAAVHKNADPAIRLFMVVGRESNLRGMGKWLEANAPIGFKNELAFFHEKKWKLDFKAVSPVEVERELLAAIPFWRVKASAEGVQDTPLDYLEMVRAILKRAETNGKKLVGKKEEKHREMLDQLAKLCNDTQYA